MSIDSEAEKDLSLEADHAENVVGGHGKSKKAAKHSASKPLAGAAPVMITVEPTTPAVPSTPDPGADSSGPEADDC
jgi:hypothetical protein